MAVGTLCRLVPVDAGYRVEVGDVGETIGTVMCDPYGLAISPWRAVWNIRDTESGLRTRILGRYETPELAALALAAEFVSYERDQGRGEVGYPLAARP